MRERQRIEDGVRAAKPRGLQRAQPYCIQNLVDGALRLVHPAPNGRHGHRRDDHWQHYRSLDDQTRLPNPGQHCGDDQTETDVDDDDHAAPNESVSKRLPENLVGEQTLVIGETDEFAVGAYPVPVGERVFND